MSKNGRLIMSERTVVGTTITQTTWIGGYRHWLKDRRHELGISFRKFAKKAGISTGALQSYENGSAIPSVEYHYKISAALGDEIAGISFIPRNGVKTESPWHKLANAIMKAK